METTVFIAQLLGMYYLAVGVGMLLNRKHYIQLFAEVRTTSHFMFLSGLLALVAGFAIIKTHSVWDDFWTGLVSLVGWMALVKGLLLLVLPSFGLAMTQRLMKMKNFIVLESALVLVLGALLGWYGFLG